MFVNKTGKHHLEYGQNGQDYGTVKGTLKMVCDGCSEGAHTEVGAKAFVHLREQGCAVDEAFERLTALFGQTAADVRDFLCFTILQVEEQEEGFLVSYCGDGYVILEDTNGAVTFLELSDGACPKYYAYNYVSKNHLLRYRDGVRMEELYFSKEQYRRVGAATDGLRYVLRDALLCEALTAALLSDREVQVKRFANKYQEFLKDDLTIVW